MKGGPKVKGAGAENGPIRYMTVQFLAPAWPSQGISQWLEQSKEAR